MIGHATKPAASNGCDWDRAIYVSPQDVLTKGTADQLLLHNRAGAKNCGWKPHKK